jgi:hypothetical protein
MMMMEDTHGIRMETTNVNRAQTAILPHFARRQLLYCKYCTCPDQYSTVQYSSMTTTRTTRERIIKHAMRLNTDRNDHSQ